MSALSKVLGLKVEEYDTGRFLVDSYSREKDGVQHLVDLFAFDGFGQCGCEHFDFALGPRLREDDRPEFPCAHIVAAKLYFAGMVIERMLDITLTKSQTPPVMTDLSSP